MIHRVRSQGFEPVVSPFCGVKWQPKNGGPWVLLAETVTPLGRVEAERRFHEFCGNTDRPWQVIPLTITEASS